MNYLLGKTKFWIETFPWTDFLMNTKITSNFEGIFGRIHCKLIWIRNQIVTKLTCENTIKTCDKGLNQSFLKVEITVQLFVISSGCVEDRAFSLKNTGNLSNNIILAKIVDFPPIILTQFNLCRRNITL